ncbi:permease [Oryzibacter oryziterrae]|uniref:permease n=1 Tax=Oryzibacter oryziterrae TaxID=2766474 RepID=UPI001F4241FB|nr:permease [Oryzibacter oryziterrae]
MTELSASPMERKEVRRHRFKPLSFGWFAAHEARLAWREFLFIMSGGRKDASWGRTIWALVFLGLLHWGAWYVLGVYAPFPSEPTPHFLMVLSVSGFFAWTLMLAQALEQVTRVIYARADLDLIMSSPAPMARVLGLRIFISAISTTLMAGMLLIPVIDAMAIVDGPRWLMAYGVLFAGGATAATVSIGVSLMLLKLTGVKRTRTIAQVLAAIIGAGFTIGAQVVGILSMGSSQRMAVFDLLEDEGRLPALGSLIWWPARAASGELLPLIAVMSLSLALLVAAIGVSARRFGAYAGAFTDAPQGQVVNRRRTIAIFKPRSVAGHLRVKELTLLKRDPWLLSQTLMQILYLIPPALLLWTNTGTSTGVALVLAPVLTMAAGQLAGGLAWLTLSGEDAPELIATAPVASGTALRAKVEAVFIAVALPVTPLLLGFALVAPLSALTTLVFIALATGGATVIQFLFRKSAKRSHFRRRQTASRIATFTEAFGSIGWAGAAALTVTGSLLWTAIPMALAVGCVGLAFLLRPRG